MQALLMAGGGGTRLWPLSTETKPKQFLALFDDRSLLRTTFERILPIIPASHVWLSGNYKHQALLLADLPELSPSQLILEPAKRDNAAAICLALLLMSQAGIADHEVIVMLPCDHRIGNETRFREIILQGEKFLKQHPQQIVTIGIHPTHPETGYGYIEHTDQALLIDDMYPVMSVKQFVEKPNLAVAETYLASGKHLWNSGIYMWTLGNMLHLFETLLPEIFTQLKNNLDRWAEIYPELMATSLDYGISEKIDTIATIPAKDLEWNDVGDFRALGEHHSSGVTTLDVSKSYLRNDTTIPIRIIGLENVVVVSTEEGLLVCHRDRAQDIKKLL